MKKHMLFITLLLAFSASTAMAFGPIIAPNPSKIFIPHHEYIGAQNLCAHVVQLAKEKNLVMTAADLHQKLSLCAQGRFNDIHKLLASPEPTIIYSHPGTGELVAQPAWISKLPGHFIPGGNPSVILGNE